ncbi:MAG: tRNA (5-methylaminomethyl-2-thiouridine)(34)-methyltransferase MnmD [Pseudomonadota bacterium]
MSPRQQSLDAAPLIWREGGVPVSERFDDPYFSLQGGLAETLHVFLAGNGLPGRLREGFRIAELGFGTGLNLLATARAWAGPGRISFTSFEAYPMAAGDMARALAAFPELSGLAADLVRDWGRGLRAFALAGVDVQVIEGDAAATLPHWDRMADAWYLDGFSPAKNPDLWSDALMAAVARHTAPGGTFATYTAAGHVRRALEAAGFAVGRRPGFGRKRHMTAGVLR